MGGYPKAWRNDMPGSGGWHTFGVDWSPGKATFYYDGKKVGTQKSGVTGKPHYLILNLGVSGSAIRVAADDAGRLREGLEASLSRAASAARTRSAGRG